MNNRTVSLTPESGGLALRTPYDRGFVMAFKMQVPSTARRWNGENKVWLVDPSMGNQVADLCAQYFQVRPQVPAVVHRPSVETRILEVRYLGITKDRGGADERSAYGYVGDSWSALFPERVLMEWFCAVSARPGEQATLFAVLGVSRDADPATIKAAYRRLAKQWHPDTSKEPDTAETFKAINEAYQVLTDDSKRRKYLAGLALERSLSSEARSEFGSQLFQGYRSPLRCGLILAEGSERLSIFWVSKIQGWQDITDQRGRVLISSWPAGAQTHMEVWL